MKMMRNKRTGHVAVYDQSVVEGGLWEEVVEGKQKPTTKDEVKAGDKVEVELTRGSDEGVERKA